jgi:hypothetical protein
MEFLARVVAEGVEKAVEASRESALRGTPLAEKQRRASNGKTSGEVLPKRRSRT